MQSSSRNGAKVRLLALHTTEGIMRAEQLRAWLSWPGSSHAACDETGVLLSGAGDGFVDYERAAWTLRNGNPISDNLEQCGWARWTREEWLSRPKLLDAAAKWLADRHKARGIPLVKIGPADILAGKAGVIGHIDWTLTGDGTHTDPGKGYPYDVVLSLARDYAGGIQFDAPEDEMASEDVQRLLDMVGAIHHMTVPDGYTGPRAPVLTKLGGIEYAIHPEGGVNSQGEVVKRLRAIHGLVSDPTAFAAALSQHLGGKVDQATVEAGVRAVLGALDTP